VVSLASDSDSLLAPPLDCDEDAEEAFLAARVAVEAEGDEQEEEQEEEESLESSKVSAARRRRTRLRGRPGIFFLVVVWMRWTLVRLAPPG